MNKYLQINLKTAYYITQDKNYTDQHTLDLSRAPIHIMLNLSRAPIHIMLNLSRAPIHIMLNLSRAPIHIMLNLSRAPIHIMLNLSRAPIQTMLCLLVASMATAPPAASTLHFVRDMFQLSTRPFDELEWFHVAVSTQYVSD